MLDNLKRSVLRQLSKNKDPFTAKTIRSRKSTVETFAALTRRREAKIGTDRLLMSVPFFAYWKNSFFSFCFYNMQRDTCN